MDTGSSPPEGDNPKFYIQIDENELAEDYPVPEFYKIAVKEMDECKISMILEDWSIYNSESRLIPLELLPMEPFDHVVDCYASGNGIIIFDDHSEMRSISDRIPIFTSPLKEWRYDFGQSSVLIRTELDWYRLGEPSELYSPWYEPVKKLANLADNIFSLFNDESWVSSVNFSDVIKKVSEFDKHHPAYISSEIEEVEKYVVVHGQIIMQRLLAFYSDPSECGFITELCSKMEEKQQTKILKEGKNAVVEWVKNSNPTSEMVPEVSKSKTMVSTTTRMIDRIWRGYYLQYSDDLKGDNEKPKDEVNTEQEVDVVNVPVPEIVPEAGPSFRQTEHRINSNNIKWDGEPVGSTCSGEPLFRQAILCGEVVFVGGAVVLEVDNSEEHLPIYFVEYMFETSDATKMVHGRVMQRGSQTVLGDAANEREVFLTNDCLEFELGSVKHTVVLVVRQMSWGYHEDSIDSKNTEREPVSWGYQLRKGSVNSEKTDRERAQERKSEGLTIEYYCKSLYWPDKGAFFKLPHDTMGLGTGFCVCCKLKETQKENGIFKIISSSEFFYNGVHYRILDYVYVAPNYFGGNADDHGSSSAYVICQLLELDVPPTNEDPKSTQVKVRRFFRPEDVSPGNAYSSDIREVYYSEQKLSLPVEAIQGKCEVGSIKSDVMIDDVFFYIQRYEPEKGTFDTLPTSSHCLPSGTPKRKWEVDPSVDKKKVQAKKKVVDPSVQDKKRTMQLHTLDIFSGCGSLSDGLQRSGVSITRWAIEHENSSIMTFQLNHSQTALFNNCNVILRAIMEKHGDLDDCISTSEANELVKLLAKEQKEKLPVPGQVDFIVGVPPCQISWSRVQCEAILAFLSFADYFRPRFFLLVNVTEFLSINKGQTFRLTLVSLLEMGYQVRFGILEAGAYGVAQSQKRAFIWAASPEETLLEWPEPMHVFGEPDLKFSLPGNVQYAAVRSTANGAPFRAITVRDAIGDLPPMPSGGASEGHSYMEYTSKPVSWFQKQIRKKGRRLRLETMCLFNHELQELNDLNLERCKRIPKCRGADWRELLDEKILLSTGQKVDLRPWCLPDTKKYKGFFGRLDWEGNFPASVTEPQAMGTVGMCFHPEQDRVVIVRECARFQGFSDRYRFLGNIEEEYRQIGNAVSPALVAALGRKLLRALRFAPIPPTQN